MLAQLRRRSGRRGGSKRKCDRQAREKGRFLAVKRYLGERIKSRKLGILQNLFSVLNGVVRHVIRVEDFDPVSGGFGSQQIADLAFQAGAIAAALGIR